MEILDNTPVLNDLGHGSLPLAYLTVTSNILNSPEVPTRPYKIIYTSGESGGINYFP